MEVTGRYREFDRQERPKKIVDEGQFIRRLLIRRSTNVQKEPYRHDWIYILTIYIRELFYYY